MVVDLLLVLRCCVYGLRDVFWVKYVTVVTWRYYNMVKL